MVIRRLLRQVGLGRWTWWSRSGCFVTSVIASTLLSSGWAKAQTPANRSASTSLATSPSAATAEWVQRAGNDFFAMLARGADGLVYPDCTNLREGRIGGDSRSPRQVRRQFQDFSQCNSSSSEIDRARTNASTIEDQIVLQQLARQRAENLRCNAEFLQKLGPGGSGTGNADSPFSLSQFENQIREIAANSCRILLVEQQLARVEIFNNARSTRAPPPGESVSGPQLPACAISLLKSDSVRLPVDIEQLRRQRQDLVSRGGSLREAIPTPLMTEGPNREFFQLVHADLMSGREVSSQTFASRARQAVAASLTEVNRSFQHWCNLGQSQEAACKTQQNSVWDRGSRESLLQDPELLAGFWQKINPSRRADSEEPVCRLQQSFGRGAQTRDQLLLGASLALTAGTVAAPAVVTRATQLERFFNATYNARISAQVAPSATRVLNWAAMGTNGLATVEAMDSACLQHRNLATAELREGKPCAELSPITLRYQACLTEVILYGSAGAVSTIAGRASRNANSTLAQEALQDRRTSLPLDRARTTPLPIRSSNEAADGARREAAPGATRSNDETAAQLRSQARPTFVRSYVALPEDLRNINNRAYIQAAEQAMRGKRVQTWIIENTKLKPLNAHDYDFATAITNFHQTLLLKNLRQFEKSNPNLKVMFYGDYKSLRFSIEPDPTPEQARQIDDLIRATQAEFNASLRSQRIVGMEDDPADWFRAGRGLSDDEAAAAARMARRRSDAGAVTNLRSPEAMEELRKEMQTTESLRQTVIRLAEQNPAARSAFLKEDGSMSLAVAEVFRKTENGDEFAVALRARFPGVTITNETARSLHRYADATNSFNPSLLIESREQVLLTGNGSIIIVDVAGLGAEGLARTATALQRAATSALTPGSADATLLALREARLEERRLTGEINERFARMNQAMDRVPQPPAAESADGNAGLALTLKRSGDDGARRFSRNLSSTQREELTSGIAASQGPLAGHLRTVFVPDAVRDPGLRSSYSQAGAALEKALRAELEKRGGISRERLSQIHLAVDLNPEIPVFPRGTNTPVRPPVTVLAASGNNQQVAGTEQQRIREALSLVLPGVNAQLQREFGELVQLQQNGQVRAVRSSQRSVSSERPAPPPPP